jgi:hypothetical protein
MRDAKRRWRLIERVLGTAIVILLLFGAYLWSSYAVTRSKTPIVSEGRVYQLDNHGGVVYLTLSEWLLVNGVSVAGFLVAATTIFIHLRYVSER